MPDTPIPPEAVEAAALKMCREIRWPASWSEEARNYWRTLASDALAAALPFLPQHVSPSVDEIARVLNGTLNPDEPPSLRTVAEAVLALFSSTPTVEQVRRETLLSAADALNHGEAGLLRASTNEDPAARLDPLLVLSTQIIGWLRARAAEAVDRG